MTAETGQPDLQIGLHALRTFRVDTRKRRLLPLSPGATLSGWFRSEPDIWRDGVCVAHCARGRRHAAPAEGCSCGIYGATNLQTLVEQYPHLAQGLVTVIAVEGQTIVGDEGLRAEAARVVAYWCEPSSQMDDIRAVVAEQCPTATRFDDCDSMLVAYGLRATARSRSRPSAGRLLSSSPHMFSKGKAALLAGFWVFSKMLRLAGIPVYLGLALASMAKTGGHITKDEYLAAGAEERALMTLFQSIRLSMDAAVRSGLVIHILMFACAFVLVKVLAFRPVLRITSWKAEIASHKTGELLLAYGSFLLAYTLEFGLPASGAIIAAPIVGLALTMLPASCAFTAVYLGARRSEAVNHNVGRKGKGEHRRTDRAVSNRFAAESFARPKPEGAN